MFPVAALLCAIAAALILYVRLKLGLIAASRLRLRPIAERLIIEKRWIERNARSREEYEQRWACEMRLLWRTQLPNVIRRVIGLRDFALALDAEFATITNQEIASWTFIDRASTSRASFEHLLARCLEQQGWRVTTQRGADRVDLHLILSKGSRRVGVYCHHGAQPPECLAVHDAAIGRTRQRCDAVCIITNGRFSRPVSVFAETMSVALLHCSQIDAVASLVQQDVLAARIAVPDRLAA